MTRIILERCFLLLAFTGILLSGAQESLSPPSDPKSTVSAPQSSHTESVSPHSTGDEGGRPASPQPTTTPSTEVSPLVNDETAASTGWSDGSNLEHSDGLFRDEPRTESETGTTSGTSSAGSGGDGAAGRVTGDGRGTEPSETPEKDATPSDDPAPSTVPSMDSRSSDVDRDRSVQSGDEPAARTRSLNATRATTEGDATDLASSAADDERNGSDRTAASPEANTLEEGKSREAVGLPLGETSTRATAHAAASSQDVEHLVSDATRPSPISLAALSSSSEDSIHPRGSATAQAPGAPTLADSPRTTPTASFELEREALASDASVSLVTFDPDGMTHNSSQEPDAVTFSPFRSDGTSTDGNGRPSVSVELTDGTTRAFDMPKGDGEDREREPPSSPGQSPHDEPDREELSGGNTLPGTERPKVVTAGVVPPASDESEEMMNDSPLLGQIQSRPTSKETEESVGNDLDHPTVASSHHAKATTLELDFSTNHPKSEQSDFRPASTPSEESSPATRGPPSSGWPQSPSSDVDRPDRTEPVSSPSPSAANGSAEAVTDAVSQTDGGYAASSIAGVAVKTSVSVSMPLSNTPNSTVDSATADDAVLPNISGILPFPIHLDRTETAQPSTDTPSTTPGGLRIRKPKLKIGGSTEGSAESTPRTRKPFLAPPQRSSSTVGPPVSIFKKSRTRVASITSSTTPRPFPQFSTIRVHYASRMPGMVPGGELVFSVEPVPTTLPPTTTETEEPFSDEPFTDPTQGPVVPPNDDDITLIKVAGCLTVDKGLRWHEQLNNRHSPIYREKANYVQIQLERLFRTSPIATQVWKIQIDGFSGKRGSRSVVIDFFLYLIKSRNEISTNEMALVFHDKLINNTFSRFTVDPSKTTFEFLNEEPMRPPTEPPESSEPDPFLPQWAIAVIVVGAASLIFIVLFAIVAILGRHHMRRRYSSKLNDEDSDRPGDWETKMAAAYENLAADTIYDADDDLRGDTYKKSYLVD